MAVARLPNWARKSFAENEQTRELRRLLDSLSLKTVCESAACPNRWECFSALSLTFMILGDRCTRRCSFCGVSKGNPLEPDGEEPSRIARAASALALQFVVITSVTRDDLEDGGAMQFSRCIAELDGLENHPGVEVLVPDFGGSTGACSLVLDAGPDVFSHNVETVPRLYSRVRPRADYLGSLRILEQAASHGARPVVKSGLMLGLGENEEEVIDVFRDLRNSGCDWVTVGQYLRPSFECTPVVEYISPERFEYFEQVGSELGFSALYAGPLVRSSYRAYQIWRKVNGNHHSKQEFFGEPRNQELR